MHFLIVSDAYPPIRSSCAQQIYDLGLALADEGHFVTIIYPSALQYENIVIKNSPSLKIISVKAFPTKDVGHFSRLVGEFINPFLIWSRIRRSHSFSDLKIDGVIWYSPSIFWGPLIKRLKRRFHCPSYLILRDIFPDWALHLGLMKKGIAYVFLKQVESYQYKQANWIGVQSPNGKTYLEKSYPRLQGRIGVLWNWIGKQNFRPCSIQIKGGPFSGRDIFVYTGNMGIAQDMRQLLEIATSLNEDTRIGFLLVGRGSEVNDLKQKTQQLGLTNIVFHDEIDSEEIYSLLLQCKVGLIFLDAKHQSHNIPGKFLTYLNAGLPVLAVINEGNDLLEFIRSHQLGLSLTEKDLRSRAKLKEMLDNFLSQYGADPGIPIRAKRVVNETFSSKSAAIAISNQLASMSSAA